MSIGQHTSEGKGVKSTGGAFRLQYTGMQVNLHIGILQVEACFAPLTPIE
ncbi:MAG: hypothetical protein H6Q59_3135 [Firmicutes bacterium]|nr:hypothetical protein [Bacillota bacterium]